VIHRDLKPANVMVGAFGKVQIMDWGLAKVLDPIDLKGGGEITGIQSAVRTIRSEMPGESTQAGDVLGTPAYMAPEQARGEVDQIDERADVFGLGAILCVILTGQPPYISGNWNDVRGQAGRGDLGLVLARLESSGADADLVRLARACLAMRKEERPRDSSAVAAAMREYHAALRERLRKAEVERSEAQAKVREERLSRLLALVVAGGLLFLLIGFGVREVFAARSLTNTLDGRYRQQGTAIAGTIASAIIDDMVLSADAVMLQALIDQFAQIEGGGLHRRARP
jgi:serine/threonine-protein kinase